jgi:hypothetical protein
MRRDVHLAALKAAGKVAFSVAFLAGCSSANETEANTDDQALRARVDAGHAGHDGASSDGGSPSCEKKFTCDDLLNAAFPTPGNYPGTQIATTPQVQSCCHDLLVGFESSIEGRVGSFEHRWDCCENHGESNEGIGFACTPWGPPVPPAMKPRARASLVA